MAEAYKCIVYDKSYVVDFVRGRSKPFINIYCPEFKIIIKIDRCSKSVVGTFDSVVRCDSDTNEMVINPDTSEASEGSNIKEMDISASFIRSCLNLIEARKSVEEEVKTVLKLFQ